MCLGEEEGNSSWRVWWEIRQTDGQSMRTPEIQAQKLCSFLLLLNWSMVDLQCCVSGVKQSKSVIATFFIFNVLFLYKPLQSMK